MRPRGPATVETAAIECLSRARQGGVVRRGLRGRLPREPRKHRWPPRSLPAVLGDRAQDPRSQRAPGRSPSGIPLVREMHPELCFWALNEGQPLRHNKKTQEGYDERVALLSRSVAGVVGLVDTVLRETRRSVVQRDDVVDALVGAVVARLSRGDLKTLPEAPERDSAGLPMED